MLARVARVAVPTLVTLLYAAVASGIRPTAARIVAPGDVAYLLVASLLLRGVEVGPLFVPVGGIVIGIVTYLAARRAS
ncbi:hypothetical protein BRD17_01285 [Halobacteriales archaeon SW_7_68_16]|nr:MAG: hypothetical protein BRD17_01285 [Halobacteriales archaeon SW_7_68_16]